MLTAIFTDSNCHHSQQQSCFVSVALCGRTGAEIEQISRSAQSPYLPRPAGKILASGRCILRLRRAWRRLSISEERD